MEERVQDVSDEILLQEDSASKHPPLRTLEDDKLCWGLQASNPSKESELEKDELFEDRKTLIKIVLGWSINDIMNGLFYIDKVHDLPLRYSSIKHYIEAFGWPLVEEIRATLRQSLDHINPASNYTHVRVCAPGMIIALDANQLRKVCLSAESSFRTDKRFNLQEQFRPMSLILLSTSPAKQFQAIQQTGEHAILALVTEPVKSGMYIVYVWDDGLNYQVLMERDKPWYALFLESMVTSLRIWEALQLPISATSESDLPIMKETLYILEEVTSW
ncbi:hypothetical protein O6H91_12G002600 [Diphasiastrum complanatum]|uniref:Uncharacterized protein n=1 Tax=Diphasiastrum complanatum TaxID=34168 RepID=A0ACC2BYF3_DIPCM|nr:hypothetical protein O6H91_12G002600 [Diphasiastrum complanatum]